MSDQARPQPPENLDGEALLEWERVCDVLAAENRLDAADRPLLTLYAETWAIYHDMMRHVSKVGAIVKWPNGTAGQSPQYKTSREVAAQLRTLLTDLGLTPLARPKVKTPDPVPATDDEF